MNIKKIIYKTVIAIFTFISAIMLILLESQDIVYADLELAYMIEVNVATNCLYVYTRDLSGNYTSLVKEMACSAYTDNVGGSTRTRILDKREWKQLADGTFQRYAVTLDGEISIGTVPYTDQSPNSLNGEKYNYIKEGQSSDANIWLTCADAKWLYENCLEGTVVVIYSDWGEITYVDRPEAISLPLDNPNSGWDPTDDTAENPWKECSARIINANSVDVKLGENVNLLEKVKAYDTCGNDITSSIIIMGNYDVNKVGTYNVSYYVADVLGSQVKKDIKVNVTDKKIEKSMSGSKSKDKEKLKPFGQRLKNLIILAVLTYFISRFIRKKIDFD